MDISTSKGSRSPQGVDMRILILAQHFYPEDVSGAVYATQLAESLVQRGHKVAFATCFPNYPKGIVFKGYRHKLLMVEQYGEVKVARSWSYTSSKKNTIRRVANDVSFSIFVLFAALAAGKPDVLLSYSPPLTLGVTAWVLRTLWRVPWVLRVEDLYPESAVVTGTITSKRLIRFLEKLEGFIYRKANRISLITEGFRRNLLEKEVSKEKLSVAPVWSDPDEIIPSSRETHFRVENKWTDKFLVLYSGNVGNTSCLEDVVSAAAILREHSEIQFAIVGEGPKKQSLQEKVTQEQLNNVTFLPFVPRSRYAEVLASADISLVTLNKATAATSLPSKVFNYMSSQRAVIAVAPSDSELACMIADCRCGISVQPGDPHALAEAILRFRDDPSLREELAGNGRQCIKAKFSREFCIDLFEQLLKDASGC